MHIGAAFLGLIAPSIRAGRRGWGRRTIGPAVAVPMAAGWGRRAIGPHYARAEPERAQQQHGQYATNKNSEHYRKRLSEKEMAYEPLNEDLASSVRSFRNKLLAFIGPSRRIFVWQYGFLLNPLLLWPTTPPPKSPSRP